MELLIWDAAEGSEFMQFLDPFGNPMPFKWETVNQQTTFAWPTAFGRSDLPGSGNADVTTCPFATALGGACLDVSGGNIFHDRMLRIRIDLTGYVCNAGDCWWRINYRSTSAVNDTTTWSVNIIGDPVRLVD